MQIKLLTLFISILLFMTCRGSGTISIYLSIYSNSKGTLVSGEQCDPGIADKACHYTFWVCVGLPHVDDCDIGTYEIRFDNLKNMNQINFRHLTAQPNPKEISFESWPKDGVKVKVKVRDVDDNFVDELNTTLRKAPSRSRYAEGAREFELQNHTKLTILVGVFCNENWQVPQCNCQPIRHESGSYNCTYSRSKLCQMDWYDVQTGSDKVVPGILAVMGFVILLCAGVWSKKVCSKRGCTKKRGTTCNQAENDHTFTNMTLDDGDLNIALARQSGQFNRPAIHENGQNRQRNINSSQLQLCPKNMLKDYVNVMQHLPERNDVHDYLDILPMLDNSNTDHEASQRNVENNKVEGKSAGACNIGIQSSDNIGYINVGVKLKTNYINVRFQPQLEEDNWIYSVPGPYVDMTGNY